MIEIFFGVATVFLVLILIGVFKLACEEEKRDR